MLLLLECAVLAGADLSGLPLAIFERDFSTYKDKHAYEIIVPKMMSIKMDAATKLDKFSIIAVSFITDSYLKSNPHDPALERLIKFREIPWTNPLLGNWSGVDLHRLQGDYSEDPEKYAETAAYMRSEIEESELNHLTQEASLLGGHLNHPRLQAIPFFAKFTAALAALNLPDDIAKRAGNTWSAKAEQAWKAEKPPICAEEHPSFESLIFDLGGWPRESTSPTKAVPGVSGKK